MTRKILAIVLALAMVFALCLTACGGEQAEEKETTKAAEKDTTKAEEKDTTAADTDEGEFELETIDWYCSWDMSNRPDFDEYVWPTMQEYFLENLNLEVNYHGFGSEYSQKFQAALTSNTGIDLMGMANSNTGFYVWYERNALEPLDDLLAQYAPALVANMPDYAFQSCTIDGKIYGMPTIKDLAIDDGFYYNETLMQELDLEETFYNTPFENGQDLDEFLHTAQAARNEAHADWEKYPVISHFTSPWAYFKGDQIIGGVFAKIAGLGCFEAESDTDLFNMYASEDYTKVLHVLYNWVQDNITPYDGKSYEYTDIRNEGVLLGQFEMGLMVAVREQYAEYGWIQELRHPEYAFTYTQYPLACFHSINALTTDSKKVGSMRLYSTLAEDGYAATTMRFGVEDLHWQRYTDDNGNTRCTFNFEGSRNGDASAYNYYCWYFAQFGDLNAVFLPDTQGDAFIEAMNTMNNNAKASQYMGFLMATTPVENEIAACSNVIDEYNTDLMYGMIEDIDGRVDAFNAGLEANGIQAIIDEATAQITEWKSAQ